MAYRNFNFSPYSYALNNSIKLIDIGGLYPGNIVNSDGQLSRAFMHLMELCTGIDFETLLETTITFSDEFHEKYTGMTSGATTMYHEIIFTEDYDAGDSPNEISEWFSILPHEMGHRAQSDNSTLYLTKYFIQGAVAAIKKGSLDPEKLAKIMPMEIEADYIQAQFNKFYNSLDYTKNGKRRNKLDDLFSYGIKDQDYLIKEINKMWREYQWDNMTDEEKQKNYETMTGVNNLPEGKYEWNGNRWVKQ